MFSNHFPSKQDQIKTLMAGYTLPVNEDGCMDVAGNFVPQCGTFSIGCAWRMCHISEKFQRIPMWHI
jgi:hypothetical protein